MSQYDTPTIDYAPAIARLDKDTREAMARLSDREARYLVDRYYQIQEGRKRSANQARATTAAEEPCEAIKWLFKQDETLENRIRSMLDLFSNSRKLGVWARSNKGIGPVIAAGLLAHIDFERAKSAGAIWSFAGLDPRKQWEGREKTAALLEELFGGRPKQVGYEHVCRAAAHFHRRVDTLERHATNDKGAMTWTSLVAAVTRKPHNGGLKTLCWKIGESFVKVSGNEDAYYGRLYVKYRAEEDEKNASGARAEFAAEQLQRKNYGKDTDAYKHYSEGRLPPAHVFAMTKRRVVKLFLSHYFEVGYGLRHGKPAPRPWAIEHGGHTEYIPPPNWPME